MTAAQFEELETPEVEAVLRWRFEELVRAGYDAGSAMILASHVEVDLHDAEPGRAGLPARDGDADRPLSESTVSGDFTRSRDESSPPRGDSPLPAVREHSDPARKRPTRGTNHDCGTVRDARGVRG